MISAQITATEEVKLVKTRNGYPAYWESGGGMTNTGNATIVAGKDGGKKTPIFIKRSGHLAGGEHALFGIEVGDWVIEAYHHRKEFEFKFYRIKRILPAKDGEDFIRAEVKVWAGADDPVVSIDLDAPELPAHMWKLLEDAIAVARKKATDYHCRVPYYCKDCN